MDKIFLSDAKRFIILPKPDEIQNTSILPTFSEDTFNPVDTLSVFTAGILCGIFSAVEICMPQFIRQIGQFGRTTVPVAVLVAFPHSLNILQIHKDKPVLATIFWQVS